MHALQSEVVVEEKSHIAAWYAGKNILITGATGFMGKVLVEKLLRSCPDLNKLYLLIRSKRDQTPEVRKEQYFKCVVFKKVLEKNPDAMHKLFVVSGDILEDDLGISRIDRDMLATKIDVIFHCAANVRFDQPLRPMILMNVVGTLKILKLASKMLNLKVFVHVSTTFCHCNEQIVEERAYQSPHNPYIIMDMVNELDDDELNKITPKLLNGLPNTYALSKALSEDLINRYEKQFSIVVTRPSIVTAALKEPFPGWIESVNGPTGLIIGGARGIIRSMYCNPDNSTTIIPVDTAINGMIAACYHRSQAPGTNVEFINMSLANKSLHTWGECIDTGKRLFYETPLSFSLWYPNGFITKSYVYFKFCVIFFHYLPAYFIDLLLILMRRKPFLVKIQNKVSTGIRLMQYYTTKEWTFNTDKFERLMSSLNRSDAEIFDMDTSQLNYEEYIRNYIIGIRNFMLGENESTIPRARSTLRFLYILDCTTKLVFGTLLFWILWIHVDSFVEKSDSIIQSAIKSIYIFRNKTLEAEF